MERKPLIRLRLVYLGLLLGGLVLGVRLFFIQIVQGSYYRERADRQYERPADALPDRGSIYFETKDNRLVSAAAMQDGFILALNPRQITDAPGLWRALSPLVALDSDTFFAKANLHNDPYEELLPRLDEATASAINQLDLPGVELIKTRWRSYPAGSLAAHTVGFMGYDGDTLTGKYGIEREYNEVLERTEDHSFSNFLAEAFSEVRGSVLGNRAAPTEADVVLTIEPVVQQVLETELSDIKKFYSAEAAGGIVMDPATGKILALTAFPTFNPGEKQTDISVLKNPLVENVYEMGSIIKPLTMAAAIDAGAVKPTTTYNDAGFRIIDDRRISNFDGRGRGIVSMQEVLNQSLNTGVVFAMEQMGIQKFRDYFLNFGLGEPTKVDLPNEVSGLVKNLKSGGEIGAATAAFGQGLAISPLETIRALASLANGGVLVTPHVVDRLNYPNGTAYEPAATSSTVRRVLQPGTTEQITEMLTTVVDKALVGGAAKLDDYSIAAKTGTAQIANPAGGYYADRYLHSFFGYFPAKNPKFIIFMYLIRPHGVEYASATLTQPFMNTAKFLLNYYHIPPDRAAP